MKRKYREPEINFAIYYFQLLGNPVGKFPHCEEKQFKCINFRNGRKSK